MHVGCKQGLGVLIRDNDDKQLACEAGFGCHSSDSYQGWLWKLLSLWCVMLYSLVEICCFLVEPGAFLFLLIYWHCGRLKWHRVLHFNCSLYHLISLYPDASSKLRYVLLSYQNVRLENNINVGNECFEYVAKIPTDQICYMEKLRED
jgi:hypothetical protein